MANLRTNRRLFWFFLLAAVLHWFLKNIDGPFGINATAPIVDKTPPPETPIVIERADDPRQTVVQSSRAKEDPSLKDKTAKYGGEFRNRVQQETQSPQRSRFHEGGPKPVPRDPEGADGAPTLADLMAFGGSPNHFADSIAQGTETLLNTDPIRYASFINRIADEVYDPWVVHAREAVKTMYLTGRKLESNVYITKLQVVMDSTGEVRAIQTLKGSGIRELDEAPKKAFWETEPFAHPPVQMFEKETLVRFIYEFHFEWQSSSFNIVPWTI